MKRIAYFCGVAAVLSTTAGFAQVVVDDYELYGDSAAAKGVYVSVAGNGAETVELGTTDGADGTAKWLKLVDTGFTCGIGTNANFIVNPPAGTYRLGFYYKNGIDGGERWRGIKVSLTQNAALKTSVIVDPGVTGTPTTEWTYAESEPFSLDTNNISLRFDSNQSNGAAPLWTAAVDEIKLIPILGPALSVYPDDRIYLSGSTTIVATPEGGMPPYTVEFNINNDASIEATVNSAPYEYVWNTLTDVPDGTSRTLAADNTPVTVSIKVTDNDGNEKELIEEFTVDNMYDGRESLIVNGDFSQWQGTGFGTNLPVGWHENWVANTVPQYGIGLGRNPQAGDALQIKLTNATGEPDPFSDRYALRSDAVQGIHRDHQVTFWGKGQFSRLYYLTSEDGVTFTTTLVEAAKADSADIWFMGVGAPATPAALELTESTHTALGTHQLGTTDHFWDDITWNANELPEGSSVDDWKLY